MDHPVPKNLKDNPEMLSQLQYLASSPHTLFRAVVLEIRKCLGKSIDEKVNDLPLPLSMRREILMIEFL